MDKVDIDIDASNVAGVVGLIGVRSGTHYYAGRLDSSQEATMGASGFGPGYVPLRDAYELVVQHRPQRDGTVEMTLLPLHIAPFRGPIKIIVRVDVFIDLSECEDMVEIDRAMVGSSILSLPGMSGRQRPGNS
jgi:hypothetical protein